MKRGRGLDDDEEMFKSWFGTPQPKEEDEIRFVKGLKMEDDGEAQNDGILIENEAEEVFSVVDAEHKALRLIGLV